MTNPPQLWAFALVNILLFSFGASLTGMSYFAYRLSKYDPAFRNATIGFGLITVGGVSDLLYQLVIKRDYNVSGRELLTMQTIEGLLIALGLGLLFYSIYGYHRRKMTLEVDADERIEADHETDHEQQFRRPS